MKGGENMPYINEMIDDMQKFKAEYTQKDKLKGVPMVAVERYTRIGRGNLLNIAVAKKNAVVENIKQAINDEVVQPLKDLDNLENEINKLTPEKNKYEGAVERYEELSDNETPDYVLYLSYYDDTRKKRRSTKSKKTTESNPFEEEPFEEELKNYAKKESLKIASKKRNSIIACGIVSIICMILDAWTLYPPIQLSNIGDVSLMILMCIVLVVCIDVPPTVLGIFSSNISNLENIIQFKQSINGDVSSEQKAIKKYKKLSDIGLFFTILMFTLYFFARFIIFIGGGNFDIGMKNLIALKFFNSDVTFSFVDMISVFPPIITSLMSYMLSSIITKTESKFINEFAVKIRGKINIILTQCNNKIADIESIVNTYTIKKQQKKTEIWTKHCGAQPMPVDFNQFITTIILAAQKDAITLYRGRYENFCRQAREETIREMSDLTTTLFSYSDNPKESINMNITEQERQTLDSIWKLNEPQTKQTLEDIERLNSYIQERLDRLNFQGTTTNANEKILEIHDGNTEKFNIRKD